MQRAGVFIGVDRTGGLQPLKDAAAGARRMHAWALSQGIPPTHAHLITDEGGSKVHPDLIYDAIKALVEGPGIDQLVVYFAGHGVNINRGEQWLLTDAPQRTSAAVNVTGSFDLAQYCGIRHVVFVSDACRVAPEGIQAQNVRGVDIFPNDGAADRAKPVDRFFACVLGKTAAEIKDPAVAAAGYSALYTSTMLDALNGAWPDLFEPSPTEGDPARYLSPENLERCLEAELPRRVKALRLEHRVNQSPEAFILSRDAWLARLEGPEDGQPDSSGSKRRGPRRRRPSVAAPTVLPRAPKNLGSVAQSLVHSTLAAAGTTLDAQLRQAGASRVAGAAELAASAGRIASPFGPDHFETQCGIKVRGARVVEFFAPRAKAELLGSSGEILRINDLEGGAAASVLLRFEGEFGGCVGAVIPALPGFLAALTFEGDELIDVAYEPSENSGRWEVYKRRAADVRALRAVAASASRHGRFRLNDKDADDVASRMQYAKGIDPTLAVYAAYAYHDLQATEKIREMSGHLRNDVGVTLFDLALLGRTLIGKAIKPEDGILPFVPLLGQGWSLIGAHRVALHPALKRLEGAVRDSLWSLYDRAGIEMLRKAMLTKEVR